jgi:hypothetical protein
MAQNSHARRTAAVALGDREPQRADRSWVLPLIALLVVSGLAIALIAGLGRDNGSAGDRPPAIATPTAAAGVTNPTPTP